MAATLAPPPVGRPRQLITATVLGGAAATMLIGALLGAYLAYRDATPSAEWPPAEIDIPNVAVLTLTLGLVMSAVSAAWVYAGARSGDLRAIRMGSALTILLGLAHLNGMAFVWSALELPADSGPYAAVVYAATGTHTAIVIAGIVGMVALLFQGLGGQLIGDRREPATAAVLGWQFVVATWLLVYTIVFLVK